MLFTDVSHRPPRLVSLRGLALIIFAFCGALLSHPALAADITVASPVNGTHVSSPVWIRAHNIGCEGVPPSAFGYSIDNSATIIRGETAYDIDVAHQAIAAGTHIVHFKSWTARGACPVVNTQFTVGGSTTSAPPPSSSGSFGIPANASSSGDLDGKGPWGQVHDGGTPGSSRGSSVYPATTPVYDDARKFYMTYTDRGGERWNLTLAKDSKPTHFVLDTYVFLPNPSEVLNLELDINQVMANGETVILATQCAGITGTGYWESGYTSGKLDHWWASGIHCDPRTWTPNVWHHIQIGMHRDSNGVVTHDWVTFDGTQHAWGYTHESAHFLGWAPGVVDVQYQIEGSSKGSGSVTSYIHKLTVYRW
ncbi:MAG TPA: hypothetical protein VN828_02765 [Acidobacteriaceae bacterium]|nr:hypothetical protein [Acidobacteriaceae bacterium]